MIQPTWRAPGIARCPRRVHHHRQLHALEKAGQPSLQPLKPRLRLKGLRIRHTKLPHKGQQRPIGQAGAIAQQPCATPHRLTPTPQDRDRSEAMLLRQLSGVAIRILVAIEVMFKRPIVLRNQSLAVIALSGAPAHEPALGISLLQRPSHDCQALVDHATIWQHQHGHCCFGGGRHQLRWLGLQRYLPQLQRAARLQTSRSQRQTGPHRIGAAAKAIENRPHKHHHRCVAPRAHGPAASGVAARQNARDRHR